MVILKIMCSILKWVSTGRITKVCTLLFSQNKFKLFKVRRQFLNCCLGGGLCFLSTCCFLFVIFL